MLRLSCLLLLVTLGCSPEDYTLELSPQGAAFVAQSCTQPSVGPCESTTTFDTQAPTQIRVALSDPGGTVHGASRCAEVRLCGVSPEHSACNASRVNEALDSSLTEGLTYEDLEDPGQAELTLLLYNDAEATGSSASRCLPDRVFACARMTLVSEKTFDVTCAACALSKSENGSGACSEFLSHFPNTCPVDRCRALAEVL